jgi:hypothetical protein
VVHATVDIGGRGSSRSGSRRRIQPLCDQRLEARQFRRDILEPRVGEVLLLVQRLGQCVLEALHVVAHPLRLVLPAPVGRLEVVHDGLELEQCAVQALCPLLLRGFQDLGVLCQLLYQRESTLELLVYCLLVLLEALGRGGRDEGIYVALRESVRLGALSSTARSAPTFVNVSSPYPTPPTTVAMMNQSLQSLLGIAGDAGCQP